MMQILICVILVPNQNVPKKCNQIHTPVHMSLFSIYITAGLQFRQDFSSTSPVANILDQSFKSLLESSLCTTAMFDNERDKLRDELSSNFPDQFQRFGR